MVLEAIIIVSPQGLVHIHMYNVLRETKTLMYKNRYIGAFVSICIFCSEILTNIFVLTIELFFGEVLRNRTIRTTEIEKFVTLILQFGQ
jgi:hypothetical protein